MTDKLTSTERLQSQMSSSNADSELVGFISSELNHLPPTVCLEFSHLWKQGGRQPLKQPLQQKKKIEHHHLSPTRDFTGTGCQSHRIIDPAGHWGLTDNTAGSAQSRKQHPFTATCCLQTTANSMVIMRRM